MKLQKVKPNPHSSCKIFCSSCYTMNDENKTYADLDIPFRYICQKCAKESMEEEL